MDKMMELITGRNNREKSKKVREILCDGKYEKIAREVYDNGEFSIVPWVDRIILHTILLTKKEKWTKT